MTYDWGRAELRINAPYGRVRTEPSWRLDRRWGEGLRDLDFWFVRGGRGVMRIDGAAHALEPGTLVIARPGHVYEAERHARLGLLVTYIHFDLIEASGKPVRAASRLPAELLQLPDVHYVDAVSRRVVELCQGAERSGEAGKSEQLWARAVRLFSALLSDVCGEPAAPPGELGGRQRVLAAAQMIDESPQAAWSVTRLARSAGYAPDHFARLFRQALGQSPRDYLIDARLQRARQLLVETERSVAEIAEAMGYGDVAHFSRQFKAKIGITPSRARKGWREQK